MITKLINNDLKKVNGGVYISGDEKGDRGYGVEGVDGFYRTLKEAIDVEWDLHGVEYRDGNYPGFGTPIPNRELLFSAYNHLFGHLTEDTDWTKFLIEQTCVVI